MRVQTSRLAYSGTCSTRPCHGCNNPLCLFLSSPESCLLIKLPATLAGISDTCCFLIWAAMRSGDLWLLWWQPGHADWWLQPLDCHQGFHVTMTSSLPTHVSLLIAVQVINCSATFQAHGDTWNFTTWQDNLAFFFWRDYKIKKTMANSVSS